MNQLRDTKTGVRSRESEARSQNKTHVPLKNSGFRPYLIHILYSVFCLLGFNQFPYFRLSLSPFSIALLSSVSLRWAAIFFMVFLIAGLSAADTAAYNQL